ncbi:MAG: hypothetical protein E7261_11135 [Lachnospiraceae bacterium]|nr:hypothetical protein [Lachnospiraceae bacterium]
MEYLIVIIAAMLAGVGTGLVGLSAATAMVPLLIVLCPTFQGEHGAFMATAIALASDILGSAVTSAVYAKNKKIDLKHGWLLCVCIISMCTVGSIVAYFTHQQVLGGFSLFLCVAIGIRFLVKPGSKDKATNEGVSRLTVKEIAVSLFFGLTIGFGTGFFGSGGGMMMLIVFTAMLGYERRTAVGTSTFIMTFTALIASVSHILIEPTILFECWDYLIISIITATVFSMVSARFANKVNVKIVGYVTGALLFGLGIVLVFLNYREYINMTYFAEFWKLLGIYFAYIILLATILIIVHFTTKIPRYIFRKLLHIVAFTSILPLVLCTDYWWIAVLVQLIFLAVVIVALSIAEKFEFYKSLFVEKEEHEVITSFIILFGLITVLLVVFWGVFGSQYKYVAVAAIMAWGPGDAAAAIVGRNFGEHKLSGKWIEGVKSVEGCVAMAVTSFGFTLLTLVTMSGLAIIPVLVLSGLIAPVAAFVELYTKKGLDTVTVPIATALLMGVAMIFI